MQCPRCKTQLVSEVIDDLNASVEIDKCTSCGGIWFEKGELAQFDKIIEPILLEIRNIPGKTEQLKALCCPSCNNLQIMQKAEHERDQKVLIDYCPVCHGIWLDKGELEAIQKENWVVTILNLFRRLS